MGDALVTPGILALVVLAEGVRRIAPGTIVLEAGPRGWRVARTFELGSGMHLLSLCLPVTTPLVLGDAPRAALSDRRLSTRLRARARRVRRDLILVRVLGLLVVATLVLGLPFAVRRYGAWGLITALQILLVLCLAQTAASWIALMRAGAAPRDAAANAIKMMWPFSAPRAPQMVVEQVAAGAPPLVAARTLIGDTALLRSMRSAVYDAVHGADPLQLLSVYDRAELQRFLAESIDNVEPYCPRCGTVYRVEAISCGDCGLELRRPSSSLTQEKAHADQTG